MQVEKTKENIEKCRCMHCPSYSEHCKLKNAPANFLKMLGDIEDHEHFEKMFCAFEKSHCINKDNGCICDSCEVYKKYGLCNRKYCLHADGV